MGELTPAGRDLLAFPVVDPTIGAGYTVAGLIAVPFQSPGSVNCVDDTFILSSQNQKVTRLSISLFIPDRTYSARIGAYDAYDTSTLQYASALGSGRTLPAATRTLRLSR